jgi:hypothetical protein
MAVFRLPLAALLSSLWLSSAPCAAQPALRGITVGPIESSQQPERGYGSDRSRALLDELARGGANAVSVTPFGRLWSLSSTHIEPSFEWPQAESERNVARFVSDARARGMSVLLIPHLWVETGGWRGEIEPGGPEGWAAYQSAYRAFVLRWAQVAERAGADIFSIGVECKSWSGRFGPYWLELIEAVRARFHGKLTYSANWDEADDVLFWDRLDYIGINAFYPLAEREGASYAEYARGAERALARAGALSELMNKRVLFVELGYTTRDAAAVQPWLWPDTMQGLAPNEWEQARALAALLGAAASQPFIAGQFLWRYYADLDDISQEASWGFSPHGKLAERVLRNAFQVPWAGDDPGPDAALYGRMITPRRLE